ncbi:unnamed protein product [Nesidiocoris tenuis]|uniref:Uncharacterized protein n=1 Tax=Nesidiocoris tenuis TaxID=355587 RepID=A0A6H5GGY8_9HEMI|nr:unnamed protein product [Nesidiocoris tenuis]
MGSRLKKNLPKGVKKIRTAVFWITAAVFWNTAAAFWYTAIALWYTAKVFRMQQQYSGTQQQHSGMQQQCSGIQQQCSGIQQQYSGTQQQYSGTQQQDSGLQRQHAIIQQQCRLAYPWTQEAAAHASLTAPTELHGRGETQRPSRSTCIRLPYVLDTASGYSSKRKFLQRAAKRWRPNLEGKEGRRGSLPKRKRAVHSPVLPPERPERVVSSLWCSTLHLPMDTILRAFPRDLFDETRNAGFASTAHEIFYLASNQVPIVTTDASLEVFGWLCIG